jgi:soluble lytic murein transglycosylase-like protein
MTRMPIAAMLAGATMTSQAALWGYVDGSGVAHFAPQQLDSRYSLVIGDDGQAPAASPKVPGKSATPGSLLTWLDISPEVKRLQPWVREAAQRHGVDAELINALIAVESGFNAHAVSPKGAVGLMQLMPATAERYLKPIAGGPDLAQRLAEPRTNITVGARLMADLLRRHRRIDLALAAWSAGDGAVRRAGGALPPIDETRAHVQQVLELYWVLLQRAHSREAQQLRLHR